MRLVLWLHKHTSACLYAVSSHQVFMETKPHNKLNKQQPSRRKEPRCSVSKRGSCWSLSCVSCQRPPSSSLRWVHRKRHTLAAAVRHLPALPAWERPVREQPVQRVEGRGRPARPDGQRPTGKVIRRLFRSRSQWDHWVPPGSICRPQKRVITLF